MRHLLRILTATAVVVTAFGGAGPTAAQSDGLQRAFEKAYLTNPRLKSERARLRATDENVNQALALSRPSVDFLASAGAGIFSIERPALDDTETRTPVSVNVQVTQPIYRGGTNPASVDRAENEVLAGRASLLRIEQRVLLDAGTAYMDVVRDQAVVELRENNVVVLRRQLQATRDRFEVGEVTRTDVSQAEARVAQATADLRQATGDLAASRATYEQVVGEPPGFLVPPGPFQGLPTTRQEAIEQGSLNNPSVIEATFAHLAAGKNVRAVLGELLPRADLVGRAGHNRDEAGDDSNISDAEVLVQVTVPLYESGAVRSRVRQAKQVASQRLVEIEQARRDAVEGATIGWEQLVATRARMEALEAEVRAQEIALDGVKQEALVGTRTVLDELDAEQELLNARVDLVEAQRNEVVASLVLAASVGLLSAEPLELDVPRYDVREHYQKVRSRWLGTGVEQSWQPASAVSGR